MWTATNPLGSGVKLLLHKDVPRPLHQVLTSFVLGHDIVHLLDLLGWSGTRDETLYPQAVAEAFRTFAPMMGGRCSVPARRRRSRRPRLIT